MKGDDRMEQEKRTEGERYPAESVENALHAFYTALSNLPDPGRLSNAQKDRERKQLRDRLKTLNAAPRSDWHREFENLMQIEIESWGNDSKIDREVTIGEDAPRADFILVSSEELPEHVKSVFRIFRRKNAIEFKRPTEPVTEQMVWKNSGYGHLLIGTDRGSEYSRDELTLSIFAYRKNEKQFASMIQRGVVAATDIPGIYRVMGMTPLPYQIVIIGELKGREYAAYRALSNHADVQDVSVVLEAMKKCSPASEDRYHSILQTIELHNPGAVQDMIREDRKMESVFLKMFEPEIQAREKKAAEEAVAAMQEATAKTVANAAARAAVEATAAATAATTEAVTAAFAERLIQKDMDGYDIADVTGYDRGRIDSIARRLNRTVRWNEAKA